MKRLDKSLSLENLKRNAKEIDLIEIVQANAESTDLGHISQVEHKAYCTDETLLSLGNYFEETEPYC